MNKSTSQLLKNIILEWWSRPLPKIHKRSIDLKDFVNFESNSSIDQISLELDSNVRKIITVVGFRRVGKTYLLLDFAKNVGQENCIYINFEDERIPKKTEVLTEIINILTELSGVKSYYLLFDEIQNIPNWSLWARRIIETTNHKLIISGSSSKLASSELPTELRGRSLSIKVDPLNFAEFLAFKQASIDLLPVAQILNLAREFIKYGSFPEIVLVDDGKKYLLIEEYFQTFVQRDLIERHKLRRSQSLTLLINLLLNSKEFGVRKLSNTISNLEYNIGKYTVTRYLKYLNESFFLRELYFHSKNLKNRMQAARKAYFVDSSFISIKSNFSENLGRLMEQKIAEKLFTNALTNNQEIYYWKDYQNNEVDFITRKNEDIIKLTQVCYAEDFTSMPEREIKSLIKGAKELNCSNLEIVTWSIEQIIEKDGHTIRMIPFWKYLLS